MYIDIGGRWQTQCMSNNLHRKSVKDFIKLTVVICARRDKRECYTYIFHFYLRFLRNCAFNDNALRLVGGVAIETPSNLSI